MTNLLPVATFHLLLDDIFGERTSAVVLRMSPLDLGSIFVVVDHFRTTRLARRICNNSSVVDCCNVMPAQVGNFILLSFTQF